MKLIMYLLTMFILISLFLLIVHGGIGEDGTLQSLLDAEGVPYTGLFIMYP